MERLKQLCRKIEIFRNRYFKSLCNILKTGFIIGCLCCLFFGCSGNNSKYNDLGIAKEDKVDLLTLENLLQCDTFLLNSGVSEFRVGLYNFFPEKYLNETEVIIVEKTWEQDSISNKTVWYRLDKGELHTVDSLIWLKESEF